MSDGKKNNETIREYTEKIAQESDNAMHYLVRGIAFQSNEAFEKAVEDFSQIINMESEIDGNFLRAVCFTQMEKMEEALSDLNQSINKNPSIYSLSLRGSLLYKKGKIEEALHDIGQAISLNPRDVDGYFKRAEILEKENRSYEAIQDYTKIIELDPENLKAYKARASIYSKQNQLPEAANDFHKIIELKPGQDTFLTHYLWAELYVKNNRYAEAINHYSKTLEIKNDFYTVYSMRAHCYEQIGKLDEAISDYETYAKYSSSKTYDSALTKLKNKRGELQELDKNVEMDPQNISLYFDRSDFWLEINNIEEALNDYSKINSLDPENEELYWQRASILKKENRLVEAIKDYSKLAELYPDDPGCYFHRAELLVKENRFDEATNDYTKLIEIEPNNIDFYFLRAENFTKANKLSEALNDYNIINEIAPYNEKAYFHKGKIYGLEKKWEDAVWNYSKSIELDDDNLNFNPAFEKRAEIYYFELKDFRKAHADYRKCIELVPESMDSSYYLEMVQKSAEAAARMEERNKVIQDLSHSIKNLISSVIDPLENLKQETTVPPQIIKNALRGANLIREIVNAVNLSYKGSINDLLYDVKHNEGSDAMSLESMFTESLKQSVSNMFDGKYFSNFMRKYFPEKKQFTNAKEDWINLSQADTIADLIPFLETHFFHPDIDIANADQFVMGNEKGSAVRLLIMLQEIILNAVKYSSFTNRDQRFLKIRFGSNAKTLDIKVENSFDDRVRAKTTGTGHVIISNFAQFIGTKPVINKENDIYILKITFRNFWEATSE